MSPDPTQKTMGDHALDYARQGFAVLPLWWPVDGVCACGHANCRSAAKHPVAALVRNGVNGATKDPLVVQDWWTRYPHANIGIACGKVSGGLAVVDVDGTPGEATLAKLLTSCGVTALYAPVQVITGRGSHGWYVTIEEIPYRKLDGLEVHSNGRYVVAPPSKHASGRRYEWKIDPNQHDKPLPIVPDCFVQFARLGAGAFSNVVPLKRGRKSLNAAAQATGGKPPPETHYEVECVRSALAVLPIEIVNDREWWLKIGCALKSTGWSCAREIWDTWSKQSTTKFDPIDQDKTWNILITRREDRSTITLGTLYAVAGEYGWTRPVAPIPVDHAEPSGVKDAVGEMNVSYFVIKHMGGSAVIGHFADRADNWGKELHVMTPAALQLAYKNKWVGVVSPEGKPKRKNLADYWLAHPNRRQYESVDFVPNGPTVLPGDVLNLWRGWAVEPKQGKWPLLYNHIWDIIANRNPEVAADILRWLGWRVQHPDKCPEIALGLQGKKGCGKGIFVRTYAELFGTHAIQIYGPEHLTGRFNAHLEAKLLVFADEAFWAGDKRGESTVKALITEPTIIIERKGINAYQTKNFTAVIFAANNEWVVPATGDERRFLVTECNNRFAKQDDDAAFCGERNAYFSALNHEIENGGKAAMLWDLLHWNLGTWQPRMAKDTEALRKQKRLSLSPVMQWIELFLQEGRLPRSQLIIPGQSTGDTTNNYFVANETLREQARTCVPQLRFASDAVMFDGLSKLGCTAGRDSTGRLRGRRFPPLTDMRRNWEKLHGKWDWQTTFEGWY